MAIFYFIVTQLALMCLFSVGGHLQESNWKLLEGSPKGAWALSIDSTGKIIASNGHSLYRSLDKGTHWLSMDSSLSCPLGQSNRITCIMQYDSNIVFVGTSWHGLQESTDYGGSWISMDSKMLYGSVVLDVSRSRSGKIYFASGGAEYWSLDTGRSWQELPHADDFLGAARFVMNGSKYILYSVIMDGKTGEQKISLYDEANDTCADIDSLNSLYRPEIVKSDGEEFFAKDFWGNLFYSTDSGLSWQRSGEIPSTYLFRVIMTHGGHLIAATRDAGLYYSSDRGKTWHKLEVNAIGTGIMSIALDSENYLFVGAGTGIFHSNVSADEICR